MSVSPVPGEVLSPSPLWLVTFADLTALLVALFVLIYSMSAPVALSSGAAGFTQNGAVSNAVLDATQVGARSAAPSGAAGDLTLGYLAAVLSDRGLSSVRPDDLVSHQIEGNRLVVRFASPFLFDGSQSGADDALATLGVERLENLSHVLQSVGNPISIIVPVVDDDWARAFDRADILENVFRRAGYDRAVERFVAPGLDTPGRPADVRLVISRQGGGGRS